MQLDQIICRDTAWPFQIPPTKIICRDSEGLQKSTLIVWPVLQFLIGDSNWQI